jgi:FkbM family methyltransferase
MDNKLLLKIIEDRLKARVTFRIVIDKIKEHSQNGKIAFYPFGRLTRDIIEIIKKEEPKLLESIIGCFDKSQNTSPEDGVNDYHISEMNKFSEDISLLIVASNTFYDNEINDIKTQTTYSNEILPISNFELSIPETSKVLDIMNDIEKVYNLLADRKSKSVYLIAWISRLFNNEDLTYIFEKEADFIDSEPYKFQNVELHNIAPACKKELFSELYKTKYVKVEENDIVFDIGAYKGDTACYFADKVKSEGKIYAFEPVPANFKILKMNITTNNFENIIIPVNKGISDKKEILKFVSIETGAPWSYINSEKGHEVDIIPIDDFVEENSITKLDFIKMDVEGLERKVLKGAKNTIKILKPKLGIALYHKTLDFVDLPLLIHKINPEYKIYIRSNIEGAFGFTMFAGNK